MPVRGGQVAQDSVVQGEQLPPQVSRSPRAESASPMSLAEQSRSTDLADRRAITSAACSTKTDVRQLFATILRRRSRAAAKPASRMQRYTTTEHINRDQAGDRLP